MWWMWCPPGVTLRNGPRPARIEWVMPRTVANAARKPALPEKQALLAGVGRYLR